MSRIVLDVSGTEHQQIKALAALQGKTIKDYVLGKIFSDDPHENEAMQALQAVLSERIDNAEQQGSTGKSFKQIAEETL